MRLAVIALACLSTLFVPAAHAVSPEAQALGTCLADNTSGRDRKELARWIFVGMSAHPELGELSAVTPAARVQTDKAVAALITRLLTENCAAQVRASAAKDNTNGLYEAFRSLGELAMQELMTNAAVTQAVSGYVNYVDKKKLEAVLAPLQTP